MPCMTTYESIWKSIVCSVSIAPHCRAWLPFWLPQLRRQVARRWCFCDMWTHSQAFQERCIQTAKPNCLGLSVGLSCRSRSIIILRIGLGPLKCPLCRRIHSGSHIRCHEADGAIVELEAKDFWRATPSGAESDAKWRFNSIKTIKDQIRKNRGTKVLRFLTSCKLWKHLGSKKQLSTGKIGGLNDPTFQHSCDICSASSFRDPGYMSVWRWHLKHSIQTYF